MGFNFSREDYSRELRARFSRRAALACGVALSASLTVVSSQVAHAAAPTFDVGMNGTFETSNTYTDTAAWDEFNDITASIFGGSAAQISLSGSSNVSGSGVLAPNTDVLIYTVYKTGTYGRMFYGSNNSNNLPHFTYVVNSNAINALAAGVTASDTFTFNNSSDSTSSVFTINVSGVSDAPYVNKVILDVTDGLAATEGGTSARVPTGASGAGNTAFGFSGSSTTPSGEKVEKAFDGMASTKYLNFGGAGSDILIDAGQQFIVSAITLVTGNDEPGRDPKTVEIYGSNSAFTGATSSAVSTWQSGATRIGPTVTLSPPTARLTTYPAAEIANPNRLAFQYLRIVFPTLRSASMMQVSEIRIEGNKKSSEATFAQGAGAVTIMGDTSVIGENPASAVVTISSGIAGDVLTCGACPVNGYSQTWDATTKSLTITKASSPYSSTDLTTALQSITYNNPSHTGARNAPTISLTATDANGLTSSPITYSVGMGTTRTVTTGVTGGSTPSSITYGSTVTLQATVSAGAGDITHTVVSGDCSLSGAVLTMGKQTCKVRSTAEFDGTYSKTTSDTVTFTMSPKTITIAASSPTITAGAAVPTITPVVTGLVGNDTASVISGLTCTTTYTTSSPAGTYVSRCTGTPTATGYSVSGSVADGVVTVNSASTSSSSTTAAPSATTAAPSTTATPATTAAPTGLANLPGGGMASRTTTTTTARSSSSNQSTTTSVSSTTMPMATTTTTPNVLPDVDDGGAGIVVDGQKLTVDIERANDELLMTAGPIKARISAVSADNEKIALDSNGHLRLVQGDGLRAEVEGFDANSTVNVRFYPNPIVLGTGTVSTSGSFSDTYVVPENTPNGYNEVHMIGEVKGRPVTFALSIAVGKTSGGVSTVLIFVLLGAAVALGLLIPFALRRRREEEEEVAVR